MKILVTGNTGFLGRHIHLHLLEQGHDVYGCSRACDKSEGGKFILSTSDGTSVHFNKHSGHFGLDLTDNNAVKFILERIQPECIVHCAANPLVKVDDKQPGKIIDDNIKVTQHLSHYAPKGCCIIFLSSIVVYGEYNKRIPDEASVCLPTSVYGVTKLASETILWANKNISHIVMRLGAVIGSGLTHGVIYDFIKKLKSETPELEILGDDPGSFKPFLHITDFLECLDYCVANIHCLGPARCKYYNVCNDDVVSTAEIAALVKQATGIEKPNKWLGANANWKGDDNLLCAEIDKIVEGMGYGKRMGNANWGKLSSKEAILKCVKENL